MPIKDDAKRRDYFRDYMAKRRAGERSGAAKPQGKTEVLRARISALEAELARAKSARPTPPPYPRTVEELIAGKQAATEARKAKWAAAAAAMTPEEERTVLEKLERAEKQLKRCYTQIKNLKGMVAYYADKSPPKMSKKLHRQVLSLLHPDRAVGDEAMRGKLEKCFQAFSVVAFKFPPEE